MSYAYFGDLEEYHSKFTVHQAESSSATVSKVESAPAAPPAPPTSPALVAPSGPSGQSAPPALVEDTPYESDGHYDKVGTYMISTLCLGAYPCKHNVIDTTKGEKMYLNAVAIYERLQSQGLSHPHFEIYKDYAKIQL